MMTKTLTTVSKLKLLEIVHHPAVPRSLLTLPNLKKVIIRLVPKWNCGYLVLCSSFLFNSLIITSYVKKLPKASCCRVRVYYRVCKMYWWVCVWSNFEALDVRLEIYDHDTNLALLSGSFSLGGKAKCRRCGCPSLQLITCGYRMATNLLVKTVWELAMSIEGQELQKRTKSPLACWIYLSCQLRIQAKGKPSWFLSGLGHGIQRKPNSANLLNK
jgi:hypothetical protein